MSIGGPINLPTTASLISLELGIETNASITDEHVALGRLLSLLSYASLPALAGVFQMPICTKD